jgi:hypothetical protein
MLEGMRADYNKVDALSRKVIDIVTSAKGDPRHQSSGQRFHRAAQSRLSLGQNQRHHQPRQVGQSSRRRGLHHAR